MKPIDFPSNDHSMIFQYMRMREGPNYFMCKYKQSSVLRQDPKDAWKILGPAKYTDTGKELKDWCLQQHQLYVLDKLEPVADTSFASDSLNEEDPTNNTKMVV